MSFEQLMPLEGPDPGQTEETIELQPVETGSAVDHRNEALSLIENNPFIVGAVIAGVGMVVVKRLLTFPGLTIVHRSESTRQD